MYYLLGDHLGRTSLILDANGNTVGAMLYTPSGEARSGYPRGSVPTDRRFTGQRKEDGSLGSLYDFQARMYSPELNRWLSPDTIVPDPTNPQSLNRYTFVLENPLRYTDPTGHRECDDGPNSCLPLIPVNPFANPYGIQFTADAGTAWSEHDANEVLGAVGTIARRLTAVLRQENWMANRLDGVPLQRYVPAKVFLQVFGNVIFNRNAGNCGNCWGRADNPWGTVLVYVQNVAQNHYTYQNATHELGHTFDWRTDFQGRIDLAAKWNADPNFPQRNSDPDGYAGEAFGWQQSISTGASEEFADMFLGWAYNRWGNNAAGGARSDWMSTNMPTWTALAIDQQ